MKIEQVLIPEIPDMWPDIIENLEPAVIRSKGEVTKESLLRRLMLGETTLFLCKNEAGLVTVMFTLEVLVFESGLRTLAIPLVGGSGFLKMLVECDEFLRSTAKSMNCSYIRGFSVRGGWLSKIGKFGWEAGHEIIRCKVGE